MAARYSVTCFVISVVLALGLLLHMSPPAWSMLFPGPDPGKASGSVDDKSITLSNDSLDYEWSISSGRLRQLSFTNKLSGKTLDLSDIPAFRITYGDGEVLESSGMKISGKPVAEKIDANADKSRLAEHFPGMMITIDMVSADGNLEVVWKAVLRDGSNYVRQEVDMKVARGELKIGDIELISIPLEGAKVEGSVDGVPISDGQVFCAFEHPMSKSVVVKDETTGKENARCFLKIDEPLEAGSRLTGSCVIGVVPKGQLRRGYLYYVERERAHPYRPFLHYNSWFDIAWHTKKMTEAECMESMKAFGEELIKKRGVKLDSFCFDDGWDDNKSLWQFNDGFPNGFSKLREAAEGYGTSLGTWLSPWGGYADAGNQRIKYGQEQGFELYNGRFALSGPKYYARFKDVCVGFVRNSGVNYFKIDGVGDRAGGNVDALLRLTGELRAIRPDLFINITIGTWPSPYWLWYGDSTWRAGGDTGAHGKGSRRQQWITYRDWQTYRNVVSRSPLYPLNSIMLHGIVYAKMGEAEVITKEIPDLIDEIRSYFGSGTGLQELYITASMMNDEAWDTLAEAAKWSRDNQGILVDTHWIGGDPGEGEIYGWASWTKRKAILVLRNPDETAKQITIDLAEAFELPANGPLKYDLESPWKKDAGERPLALTAGRPHTFALKPFEVLVFEALPVK